MTGFWKQVMWAMRSLRNRVLGGKGPAKGVGLDVVLKGGDVRAVFFARGRLVVSSYQVAALLVSRG